MREPPQPLLNREKILSVVLTDSGTTGSGSSAPYNHHSELAEILPMPGEEISN